MDQKIKTQIIRSFVLGIICIIALIIGLLSQKFLGKDNELEQISEKVIDSITGLEIDLSNGSSKENMPSL